MRSIRRDILTLFCLSCAAITPPLAAQDLAAAIAAAQAAAPALAEAEAGEAAAAGRLDRARAEGNPLLRVEATAGFGRIDNDGFFGITADNVNPLALQATAEMPLFAGGRVRSAVDQARGGADLARYRTMQARLDVGVQAVAAYAEVLASRQIEQSRERLVAELSEVERQAGLRFKVGEISSSERAQAVARKAEAEAGLAAAHGRRMSAEAAFARLTGSPPGDLAPMPALPAVPASLAEALELAAANNPALKQAEQGTVIARAAERGARAQGMPTIGAFAEGGHVRDQFFPGYKANSASVGLRGRWMPFAGGRIAADTRTAAAELASAEARARQARQNLEGLVIDSWHGLTAAEAVLVASQARVTAAEAALRGIRLEARVGAKPTLAVLDAEREATEAQTALIDAEGRRQVTAWRLNALTGAGQ